jgi:hypothetical protein
MFQMIINTIKVQFCIRLRILMHNVELRILSLQNGLDTYG